MEKIIKIDYAPNTVLIVNPHILYAEVKILNSKKSNKNVYTVLTGIANHCQKCKEQVLSILN